ncbi:MAG: helix-turn-helix domain-containing protein [Thiobacillus sp.]|nr:helix-turn-helix domain-containing protein [Thiobacillus sp.]
MRELLRPGYGQALASARLVKELSLADVAAKLKLTVRQVEALESEDVAHLPGDVFLRGFVRNYARLVDLDADELIAPMDAQAAVSETITAHSEGVTMSSGGLRRWLLVPLLILGVFVIFVAVLYQWLRQGEDALVPQTAVETTTAVVTRTLPVSSDAGQRQGEVVLPQPSTVVDRADADADTIPPAHTAPSPVSKASNVSPPSAPVVVEFPTKPVLADEESLAKTKESPKQGDTGVHMLRFLASQDAWIQVVDGSGKRFSKLIRAGGVDSISGAAPFKLVVGEAAQVRLTYDGHPIDLTPFIGQKVARLTLE